MTPPDRRPALREEAALVSLSDSDLTAVRADLNSLAAAFRHRGEYREQWLDVFQKLAAAEHEIVRRIAADPDIIRTRLKVRRRTFNDAVAGFGVSADQVKRWRSTYGTDTSPSELAARLAEYVQQLTDASDPTRIGFKKWWLTLTAGDLASNPVPLPAGTFYTVEADPPWRLAGNPPKSGNLQYPTMSIPDICRLGDQLSEVTVDVGHLYLWAINPLLREAFDVMEAWGYTYRTTITWVKTNGFGTGNYFRNNTEHVLFGTRGTSPTNTNNTPTGFLADRPGRHSQKPDAFYDLIEVNSPGPYLRLFARAQREGWYSWGNEASG